MASKLESVNPAEAWKPAPTDRWNLRWAAHLYRRAGFGVPPGGTVAGDSSWDRLNAAVRQGRDKCVEQVLSGGPGQDDFNNLMDDMGARLAESSNLSKLQGWWLYRMLYTPHPLLERALLWHNHFATSVAKVSKLPLMLRQNQLFRQHALGQFRPLLLKISRDPAMLIWLDSNSNVKGKPNENFAREVMELFSLGVGNYTENDIQEAARAFTGWRAEGGEFLFDKLLHDFGSKTLLGQTGDWDGGDVVRIVLDQDVAAARYLIRKMFREFFSESESPSDELIEPLADEFRKSDYDVSVCLRTMLRSRLFYSEHAYRQRVKSPVEYVIGLLETFDARVSVEDLARAMEGFGQSLFAPPNVKGWDGGRAGLNSATLLARHNLAWRLVGGQDTNFQKKVDPLAQARRHGGDSSAEQVAFLLNLILQGDVSGEAEKKLVAFADGGKQKDGKPAGLLDDARLRELTHSILLMPEYQLA